jgi:hypothetical protein
VTAVLTYLRRARHRRAERRRLADWAWQKQTLILGQLTADIRQAISQLTLAELLGAMVPDVAELLQLLTRAGYVDLTFGGPRNPDGTRRQGTLYYLTPEGLTERYRRCGQ